MPLDSTNIGVFVDIDSLIWVTCQPQFQKSTSVFLGPILDKQVPSRSTITFTPRYLCHNLWKMLESWENELSGGQFPVLSALVPSHPSASYVGGGSDSFNIYVFFSRMIHHDELSGH